MQNVLLDGMPMNKHSIRLNYEFHLEALKLCLLLLKSLLLLTTQRKNPYFKIYLKYFKIKSI